MLREIWDGPVSLDLKAYEVNRLSKKYECDAWTALKCLFFIWFTGDVGDTGRPGELGDEGEPGDTGPPGLILNISTKL